MTDHTLTFIEAQISQHERGTYPLRTPSTRLSIKNDPTTMRGIKKTQLKALPMASLVWKIQ